jgi:hypothetical protein
MGASADYLAGRGAVECDVIQEDPDEFFEFSCSRDNDASGDLPTLYEAYASYLFDVGSGVNFTLGRYGQVVGTETVLVDQNYNVTRGLLWALQPHYHTGGYLKGEMGEGIVYQLGASNTYGATMSDTDTKPTFVGTLGYEGEKVGLKVNGVYGGDVDDLFASLTTFRAVGDIPFLAGGALFTPPTPLPAGFSPTANFNSGFERSSDRIGLLDAVLTWDPSDKLSSWINFDYYFTNDTGAASVGQAAVQNLSSLTIWGIAGAGRYAFTESTGFSLRHEHLFFNDLGTIGSDAHVYSLTGTLDHRLTDNLVLKLEARWDHGSLQDSQADFWLDDVASSAGGSPTISDCTVTTGTSATCPFDKGSENQVLGLVQLMYEF